MFLIAKKIVDKLRRHRYLKMPIPAFHAGDDASPSDLPIRVESRPWTTLAWTFLVIGGFFMIGVIIMHIESSVAARPGDDSLSGFIDFQFILSVSLLLAGVMAWRRKDIVEMDRARVKIQRCGLFGVDSRTAPLADYRGLRATQRYVEDYEVTSATIYWDIELVHNDPALCVSLFAKSRDEPSASSPNPAPRSRPDWTDQMHALAATWSRELSLPLLKDNESGIG